MSFEVDNSDKETIVELVEEILDVYEGTDWLVVKKYIIRYSKHEIRSYFSRRDGKTKKHFLNDFEKSLIKFCESKYKRKLLLEDEKKFKEEKNEA